MKTKTYLKGCEWCNATGYVASYNLTNTTEVCPVCNGNKTIIVTETEKWYHLKRNTEKD